VDDVIRGYRHRGLIGTTGIEHRYRGTGMAGHSPRIGITETEDIKVVVEAIKAANAIKRETRTFRQI
jgi:hypothetical protein